jgi:hypothetical protein
MMKKPVFYVTMTDKYLSGWGMSENKTNKLIIECETIEQAEKVERAARYRDEMRYVNIRTTKPRYGSNVLETWKTWADLGPIWTGEKA